MVDEWKARSDRPIEVPLLHVQLGEQLERLRHVLSGAVTFRSGDRVEKLASGELIVLESAIEHEVQALAESACLLTLAGGS